MNPTIAPPGELGFGLNESLHGKYKESVNS